jgi:hypothetical protein
MVKIVKSIDPFNQKEYDPAIRLVETYDKVLSYLQPDEAKLIDHLVEQIITLRESQAYELGVNGKRTTERLFSHFLSEQGYVSPEDAQQNYLDTVEPYDHDR